VWAQKWSSLLNGQNNLLQVNSIKVEVIQDLKGDYAVLRGKMLAQGRQLPSCLREDRSKGFYVKFNF
jgi:hypothetical protein